MLQNYIVMAWHNLRKHRANATINIVGLAIGMGVAMLIGLWIWDELSYDTFSPNHRRVAIVEHNSGENGSIGTGPAIPIPLGEELRKTYGAYFKRVVLSSWTKTAEVKVGEKKLLVNGNYIEPDGPALFGLSMVEGSVDRWKGPGSILISQWLANAIFGKVDALNKVIVLNDTANFTVVGVYKDPPRNSMLGESEVDFMAPWAYYLRGISELRRTSWGRNFNQCFVELADHADIKAVSQRIRDVIFAHASVEDIKENSRIWLLPMSKWHLYTEFRNGQAAGGRIDDVWLFGVIGAFVLLLACINFMNLATARSEKRAREVGIRKAVGSLRGQLIGLFYTESLLYALLAFGLALVAVQLVMPYFNDLAGKEMVVPWSQPFFWAAGLVFAGLTGVIAGSYPALYLSSFRPVKVLKGVFKAGRYAAVPRRVLVVLQFTVSVVLIIGTVVVFRQIQYAKDRPVGYSMAGLVNVPLATPILSDHFEALRDDLLKTGVVSEMAKSTAPTWGMNDGTSHVSWPGKDPQLAVSFANVGVTAAYGRVVGWQFVAGRDFIPGRATDSNGVILNEAAVKYMGLADSVGKTIVFKDSLRKVIGVIRDMVVESPYFPVSQAVYYLDNADNFLNIRLNPGVGAHAAVDVIRKACKNYDAGAPLNVRFADDSFNRKFRAEQRVGTLAGFFAVLAVFISCLGLFGMASYMAEQRVKEIGVRKVLGATVVDLWRLLNREFVYLVGISLVIATPVAYYFMHSWLQHYAYRVPLSWWIFAGAGLGAMAIALVTVSYHGIRAARANPVTALRSE